MSTNHWWIKGDDIGIGVLSGETLTAYGSVAAIRYWGVKKADDYTSDLTETSGLPVTYDRAILAGVIRNFAEDDGDLKTALYWREVYKELRREAKREANTRKDGMAYDVSAQGY